MFSELFLDEFLEDFSFYEFFILFYLFFYPEFFFINASLIKEFDLVFCFIFDSDVLELLLFRLLE